MHRIYMTLSDSSLPNSIASQRAKFGQLEALKPPAVGHMKTAYFDRDAVMAVRPWLMLYQVRARGYELFVSSVAGPAE